MDDLKQNGSGYYDVTAFKAMQNCIREGKMNIYRGDIFYVKKGGYVTGTEQEPGRPAVIVSNDIGNEHSTICEVVYLTSKEKKPLPTHVEIMCKVPSVANCEQISNVSQERLGEYIRSCTDEEMKAIDKALMISLGLDLPSSTDASPAVSNNQEIDKLKMKLEGAERELDDRKTMLEEAQKQITDAHEHIERLLAEKAALEESDELKNASTIKLDEIIKMTTERDLYKHLYERTFERLIG